MRVALLHDWLIRFGGAERVLQALHKIFPEAPIYFLFTKEDLEKKFFPGVEIRTSFLNKMPKFLKNRHRYFLPVIPVAVESLNLRDFDLVISSCSTFIKGLILKPHTLHISYTHTPPRFLWDYTAEYRGYQRGLTRMISNLVFHYVRIWDRHASERVDYFTANSKTTQARVWKYYRREAKVIYPPVSLRSMKHEVGSNEVKKKTSSSDFLLQTSYFLIVSQLVPYKNIDIAIEAFNKLEFPLVIIGEGPQKKKLEKLANKNIRFLGWQPDEVVREYFKNCKAFIFPGEDDFGIAPVEAMSFGKPVLALHRGGATETVIEGVTGEFFDDPTPEVLADGVRRLLENYLSYDPETIRKRAEEFSEERFEREMRSFVSKVTGNDYVVQKDGSVSPIFSLRFDLDK